MITSIMSAVVRLKSNHFFEWLVVAIIILSALLIGAHSYDELGLPTWFHQVLTVLDWGVTFFFVFEITIRFLAEPRKQDFFKDGWNIFDTTIVVVSLIPLNNADMALLGRLIRIFRVLRMVSIIPELRMLLNSLIKALPQLGYVMLLMFIIFYIYAAVGTTLFEDVNRELWGNVSISMLTLFRVMTFEDWTDVMYETMSHPEGSPFSWLFYLSFIFFTAFAFLNMVIGIVVNVMEDERQAATRVKDAVMHQQRSDSIAAMQAELVEIRALLSKLSSKKD